MSYLPPVIAVFALAAACAGWAVLQRWIARTEPDVRGPNDAIGCCGQAKPECKRENKPDCPEARVVRDGTEYS